MNTNLKEIAKKSSVVFIVSIIGNLVVLLSTILIGRLLGAEIYGRYVYVLSFLTIVCILPLLGINQGVVAFLSRENIETDDKKRIASFSILLTAVTSIITVILLYVFKDSIVNIFLDKSYEKLFLYMIPVVFINVLIPVFMGILKGYRRVEIITILNNLVRPVIYIVIIIVLVTAFSIHSESILVTAMYASTGLILILFAGSMHKNKYLAKPENNIYYKQLILFSMPLFLNGAVGIITANVDKYMIGYMLTSEQVGIYKMAFQFGTVSSFALTAVNSIFAPIISNLYHAGKKDELAGLYKQTTKIIAIFNMLVFGVFVMLARPIMLIPGEEFVSGSTALIIIAVGQIANAFSGSVGQINIMTGHQKYELISNTITMIANINLNIVLIPIYGINGAAIATAAALFMRSIISFVLMYRKLRMNPFDFSYVYLMLAMCAGVAAGLLIFPVIHVHYILHMIIIAAVYVIIFLGLIYKFVFTKNQIDQIKSVIMSKFSGK